MSAKVSLSLDMPSADVDSGREFNLSITDVIVLGDDWESDNGPDEIRGAKDQEHPLHPSEICKT